MAGGMGAGRKRAKPPWTRGMRAWDLPWGRTAPPCYPIGHAVDALWAKEASHLGTVVRFADDAVVLCRTEADAQAALSWLYRTAQALKLQVHPDKTRIVDLRDGAEGFDFLGFHHRLVKSWDREVL